MWKLVTKNELKPYTLALGVLYLADLSSQLSHVGRALFTNPSVGLLQFSAPGESFSLVLLQSTFL
jgi:hypothetical protein